MQDRADGVSSTLCEAIAQHSFGGDPAYSHSTCFQAFANDGDVNASTPIFNRSGGLKGY